MGTYSLGEYRVLQERRIRSLRSGVRRGPVTAAKYLAAQARLLCPRGVKDHPGYPHMYQTIRRSGSRVGVAGTNPLSGFPYVHWVNDTPGLPFHTAKVGFGDNRRSVTYASVARTGVPGFFWKATTNARRFFSSAMLDVTHKVIRGEYV